MSDDSTPEFESDPMPLERDTDGQAEEGEAVVTVKLTRKQRQVLYRLLERGPDLEKMADYSHARMLLWDFVIKLGKAVAALTAIGTAAYFLWTRGGPR